MTDSAEVQRGAWSCHIAPPQRLTAELYTKMQNGQCGNKNSSAAPNSEASEARTCRRAPLAPQQVFFV
jgi:hypothetical protein